MTNTIGNEQPTEGYIWSLGSAKQGGFLCGVPVWNVREHDGVLTVSVCRMMGGSGKQVDTEYQVFKQQFVPHSKDIWSPNVAQYAKYRKNDMVVVYARQTWGVTHDRPLHGVVKQDQIPYNGRPGSVFVDVVASYGLDTIEVYPEQLRRVDTNDFYTFKQKVFG